jgi:hypothetical protein
MNRPTNYCIFHIAISVLSVCFLAACGPKPLQIRRGSVGACEGRDIAAGDDLLGWVSVAPADRIVAAADRIGTRTGWLAQGASFRGKIEELMAQSAKSSGVTSMSWFDWTRPLHVLVQHDGKDPKHGVVALLPVTNADDARKAYAKLVVPHEKGAVTAWKMPDSKQAMQIAFPHPSTLMMAPTAARLDRGLPLARCAQETAPDALLQFGLHMGAVRRHYNSEFQAMLAKVNGDGMSDGYAGMLKPYRSIMRRMFEGTDRVEFGVGGTDGDITFDFTLQATPGSDLAAAFARTHAAGPSPMLARLPAESWMISAASRDVEDMNAQIDDSLAQLRDLWKITPEAEGVLRKFVTEVAAASGVHSAVAMHFDDEFPLAFTAVMQSPAPDQLVVLLRDGLWQVIQALFPRDDASDPSQPPPAWRAALQGPSWSTPLTALAKKLDGSGLALKWSTVRRDGLSCELLRLDVDLSKLGGGNPMILRAAGMLGDGVEGALCASTTDVLVTFGRDAIALAKTASADHPDNVTTTRWYKRRVGATPPQTIFALQPASLMNLARAFLPTVPEWPEDEALTVICATASLTAKCVVAVPAVAIAAPMRALIPGMH